MSVKLRIDFGADNAVGPGKIALLERMRDTGSLSQAARELDMSYRRAWQLLESLNASFREPVVLTSIGGKGGGGTAITELGELLIATYRRLEREVVARTVADFEPLMKQAVVQPRSASRRTLTKTSRNRSRPGRRSAT